jgi:hypothetical protein
MYILQWRMRRASNTQRNGAQPHSTSSLWLNYMGYDQLIVQQLLLEGDDGAGVPDSKEFDLGSDPAGGATPFMAARMPCVQ